MPDKFLEESAWKAFCGKRGIKDTAVLKALAHLARAEKDGPEAVAEALDELDKPLAALAKEHKGDKEAAKGLEDVRKAGEARRKEADKEAAAQRSAEAEEEDSPALLTGRMIPLLRELRKGETQLNALIGLAGKGTAVLLMRRAIAPSRRAMLADALDAKGSTKFIVGECLFEDGAVTFVVKAPAAGLAKRLKTALLQQTDLRLKVRVRGEDPNDVDEEGEEDEPAQNEPAAASAEPAPDTADDARSAAETTARLEAALSTGRPDAAKLRGLAGFAAEKAAAGDFAAARKALDMLDKLLDAPLQPAPAASSARPADEAALSAAFKARLTALLPQLKPAQDSDAGAQARVKAGQAGQFAAKHDFEQANALLDEAEALLASPSDAAPAEETGPDEDDAASGDYAERLKTAREDARAYLRANPDEQEDVDELLALAEQAGARGAFMLAEQLFDRLDAMIVAAKKAERAAEMRASIPEGAALANTISASGVETAARAWADARTRALQGAVQLAATLRSSPYEDVHPIADIVDDFIRDLPQDLDDTLMELRAAVAGDVEPRIRQFQSRGKKDVRACLDYLVAKKPLIDAFEANPWDGLHVSIAEPLTKSLRGILAVLQ